MTTEWGEKAIEHVARAIFPIISKWAYRTKPQTTQETAEEAARASILAFIAVLKEPSPEMLNEGAGVTFEDDERLKAMLRAILTEADEEISG